MTVTVEQVNSSDTFNHGREKWNANDDALADQGNALEAQQAAHAAAGHPTLNYTKSDIDGQQAAQDSALTAHKSSADHDARYVAASTLTTILRTLYDQTIGGIKTFTENLLIKRAEPEVHLLHSDATYIGKLSSVRSNGKNIIRLMVNMYGVLTTVFEAAEYTAAVNFPVHDIMARGKRLATEEYASDKAANGLGFCLPFAGFFDSPAVENNPFMDDSRKKYYPLHSGSRLKKIVVAVTSDSDGDSNWSIFEEAVDYSFSDADIVIEAALRIYAGGVATYHCDFELYAKSTEGNRHKFMSIRIVSGTAAISYNVIASIFIV